MKVVSDTKLPIKIWATDLEEEAEKQVRNISELPFIFKHVAVMPDAHAGKGSTIGTVIATKGAIIPSAVGVDIGCFRGTQKFLTTDGEYISFEEAEGKSFDIFAFDRKEGKVVVQKAIAFKTRKKQRLLKITLDTDEEIFCTYDHKFLMRDSSYKKAQDLKIEDSLMPCNLAKDSDGYLRIRQPWKKKSSYSFQAVHRMVFESFSKLPIKNYSVHHIDGNKLNNTIENLERITASAHSSHHINERIENGTWHFNTGEESERKRLEGVRRYAASEEGRKELSVRGTKNILDYMENNKEEFLDKVKDNGQRGKEFLREWNNSEEAKEKTSLPKKYACVFCGVKIKSPSFKGYHYQRKHKLLLNNNHKIIKIEATDLIEDVYCLNVPKYHNFALSSGVFVHNCGMAAARLPFLVDRLGGSEKLRELRHSIERSVPTGHHGNSNITPSADSRMKAIANIWNASDPKLYQKAVAQMGSLGGGNHFIEICTDGENRTWVMLHSGSRNIGKTLAEKHIDKAKNLMKSYFISLPDPDLAYLVQGTVEFSSYLADLQWAQKYAKANREEMLQRVIEQVYRHVYGDEWHTTFRLHEASFFTVNCHHNYTAIENHFGQNVYVTRKGAVSAKDGEWGIIPGSMGACSYIVQGKGNVDSFHSCSHGAGRKMSRTKAKQKFSLEDFKTQTAGVECSKSEILIDEIPEAYKSIDEVMANQADLVTAVYRLKQLICIKGE